MLERERLCVTVCMCACLCLYESMNVCVCGYVCQKRILDTAELGLTGICKYAACYVSPGSKLGSS